jgi:hypothetical protein
LLPCTANAPFAGFAAHSNHLISAPCHRILPTARSTSDPVSLVAEPLLVVEDKIKGEADHPGSFTTDDNSPILSPASEFFPDEGDNAPAGTQHCSQYLHVLPCAHPIAP